VSREGGISEIYGEGSDAAGRQTPIYRALRTLLCSACGTPIPSGSLFTRKSIPQFALRILPRCRRCAPFEVTAEGRPEEPGPGLLGSLLSGEEPEKNAPERPAGVDEEVERRLGPALSRSRRKQRN
jgi:hypothetical protein